MAVCRHWMLDISRALHSSERSETNFKRAAQLTSGAHTQLSLVLSPARLDSMASQQTSCQPSARLCWYSSGDGVHSAMVFSTRHDAEDDSRRNNKSGLQLLHSAMAAEHQRRMQSHRRSRRPPVQYAQFVPRLPNGSSFLQQASAPVLMAMASAALRERCQRRALVMA